MQLRLRTRMFKMPCLQSSLPLRLRNCISLFQFFAKARNSLQLKRRWIIITHYAPLIYGL